MKKTFVRNTDQKLPEVTIKTIQSLPKRQPSTSTGTHRKKTTQIQKSVNFDEPKLNSSKKIIKDICTISIKPESREKSEVLQSKITKRVNFPIDKPIYKNLLPLCTEKEPPCYSSPRDPLPKKDIEPQLSDYCDPPKSFNYVFKVELPSITSEIVEKQVKFDGCCLTRHLMLWEEDSKVIET